MKTEELSQEHGKRCIMKDVGHERKIMKGASREVYRERRTMKGASRKVYHVKSMRKGSIWDTLSLGDCKQLPLI